MTLIFILVIATLFYIGAWSKQAKVCFEIGFVLLFFFTMFRGIEMGGTDVQVYRNFFQTTVPTLKEMDWRFWDYSNEYNFGWGYTLLNSIAKTIWNNYFSFQILNTIVCFSLLYIIMSKLELSYKQKCMFLFCYFCYMFFWYFWGLLRQNIANLLLWMILIDWKPNREKRWLYYIKDFMLIYLAYLFHATAIIGFILYPVFILLRYLNKKKVIIVTVIVSCTMFFAVKQIIPVIMKSMILLAGERYEMYENAVGGGSNIVNFALRLVLVLFIYYKGDNLDKGDNLFCASAMACLLGSVNLTLAVRALEYFAIGNYGALGFCAELFQGKNQKVVFVGIYAMFIIILIRYFLVNGSHILNYTVFDWKG